MPDEPVSAREEQIATAVVDAAYPVVDLGVESDSVYQTGFAAAALTSERDIMNLIGRVFLHREPSGFCLIENRPSAYPRAKYQALIISKSPPDVNP